MRKVISFKLNGKPVSLDTDGERTLLWVLRTDCGLTGPKYGCGIGVCGSCTVLVNGEPVRSCGTTLAAVNGAEVVTIEGLAQDGRLHPLQEAFAEHGAFQCGYCTPGMILTAAALLRANPHPSREEIRKGMEENLCRCGAHQRILAAIEDVASGRASGNPGGAR
jgi:aerobic-type carbon monoxide dehydrogenase small subunit (CoxS/CutS family)